MTLGGSLESKERVRAATDIVDLVGSHIALRRQGRGFVGLCPWHDDSRPSLQVNPDRQTYKCWVCNLGGDVFSFIMKQEGLAFPEALERLAERAGITLDDSGQGGRSAVRPDAKRALFEALAWAERQHHEFLLSAPEAEPAREYLAGRGLSDESLKKFRLGYAPDRWDWLLGRARGANVTPQTLETVGLTVPRTNGPGHYDRFRGRVLFPIHDTQGRAIAFGGRVLPELAAQTPAKYINSPETPLFVKNRTLYGQDLATPAMRASGEAIIVEGYTDCVVAHQVGIAQTVAVLGTALGERHVRLLRGLAERVVLVLDGDEAGMKRANEVLELFLTEQVDLRVLTLPDGLDPCDFLLQRGADEFRRRVDAAPDAFQHILAHWIPADATRNPHRAQQALDRVLHALARAPNAGAGGESAARLKEEQLLGSLAHRFRSDERVLRERLAALRRGQSRRAKSSAAVEQGSPSTPLATLTPWEVELLELIVSVPVCAQRAAIEFDPLSLPSAAAQQIIAACRELGSSGQGLDFSSLLLACDDPQLKSLLVELDEQAGQKQFLDPEAHFLQLLAAYRGQQTTEEVAAETSALRATRFDEDEELRRLERLLDMQRTRQGLSLPTEG